MIRFIRDYLQLSDMSMRLPILDVCRFYLTFCADNPSLLKKVH
jgi:hypothetical protein